MTTTIPPREEIPAELRWNLEDIYPDVDAWEAGAEELERLIEGFAARRGTLAKGPDSLHAALAAHDALEAHAHRVWWYPALMHDEDLRRNDVESRKQRVQMILARANTESAWLRPEILGLSEDTVRTWLDEHEGLGLYRFLLDDLFRQQEHVLDEPRETQLSYAGRLGQTPSDAYTMLCTADVEWPTIQLASGDSVQLTYGTYHHLLRTSPEQVDRRRAFEALYGVFTQNRNTYAALYSGVCQRDWFLARSRNYATTLDAALHGNDIPTTVVENLISTTRQGVAPLQRYYRLRQRALGLETIHLYDGMIPLIDDKTRYTWNQATSYVVDSVAPLGPDYVALMREAFDGRWIDVAENEGKRSGAYSAPVYGVHPYVLMNYKDTLNDLFTLAHEMGHSLHTVLSHRAQPYVYSNYTIFVAEVASTLNEALLLDHLVARTEDPRERAMLLQHAIDSIVATFYTQVMFADFELQAHRLVEADEPVTAERFDEIYGGIMNDFYGDAVTLDEPYRSTWARIPHLFRSPYYVYQYATCFASAATLRRALADEGTPAVERYLELLRSGGSEHPMDQLRGAGVDLGQPETVAAVVQQLDGLVDELESALDALGGL